MGYGIKCSYINCANTSETHSLFRFPFNDEDRLKTWIYNSGNIHLELTKEQWKRRCLCEEHFDPHSIHRSDQKNRLIGLAIPRKHDLENKKTEVLSPDSDAPGSNPILLNPRSPGSHLEVLPPRKVYEKSSYRVPNETGSSSSQNSSQFKQDLSRPSSKNQNINNFCQNENCIQTRILLEASRKTLRKQVSQITWFKKKLANENLYQRKFPSQASKIIAGMQFALRPKNRKWKEEEKSFSLALFNKSPACYRLMLDRGIVLPPLKTIERWLSESNCLPVAEDCGSLTDESNDDFSESLSVKEEREEEYASMNELCEEDYGARVKEEQEEYFEEDCASMNELCEKDYGAMVKEEQEEDCASMNEFCEEDYGAIVKEEQEEYYEASVKEEFEEDTSERATTPALYM